MPFEELDKKLREGSENELPPYREDSWTAMLALLDKELPQKKRKRRGLIILLLPGLLLLGSLAYFGIMKPAGKETVSPVVNKTSVPGSNQLPSSKTDVRENNISTASIPASKVKDSRTAGPILTNNMHNNEVNSSTHFPLTADIVPQKTSLVPGETLLSPSDSRRMYSAISPFYPSTRFNQQLRDNVLKQNITAPVIEPRKKNILSRFSLGLTVAADNSLVGIDNPGKTRMALGGNLQYHFSDKLTLRAGVLLSRKIYTASPEDYNPPKNFWNYYPNLRSIDADCQVVELPLDIIYYPGKQQHWYLATGLASVLMQSEKYGYTFRPPYATYDVTYYRTHRKENQHLFSNLNISGGYTRQLNPVMGVRLEPYFRVPVSGIGYGKIKLASYGLLLGIDLHPAGIKTKK